MAIALDDLFRKIKNVTKDFEHEQQASGVIVAFDVVLDGQIITVQPITDLYAPMQDSISADELPVIDKPVLKGSPNDFRKDRKGL